LARQSLVHGGKFPILAGPLLQVNYPCAPCISLTPRTCFPATEHLFYIKTTLTSPILLLVTNVKEKETREKKKRKGEVKG
jgi:hypothetical protein